MIEHARLAVVAASHIKLLVLTIKHDKGTLRCHSCLKAGQRAELGNDAGLKLIDGGWVECRHEDQGSALQGCQWGSLTLDDDRSVDQITTSQVHAEKKARILVHVVGQGEQLAVIRIQCECADAIGAARALSEDKLISTGIIVRDGRGGIFLRIFLLRKLNLTSKCQASILFGRQNHICCHVCCDF